MGRASEYNPSRLMVTVYREFRSRGNRLLLTETLMDEFPNKESHIRKSINNWIHQFATERENISISSEKLDEYSIECYVNCMNTEFLSLRSQLLRERELSYERMTNTQYESSKFSVGKQKKNSEISTWMKAPTAGRSFYERSDLQGSYSDIDSRNTFIQYTGDDIDNIGANGSSDALDAMARGWKRFNKSSSETVSIASWNNGLEAMGSKAKLAITSPGPETQDIVGATLKGWPRRRTDQTYEMRKGWHHRTYARGEDFTETLSSGSGDSIDGRVRGWDMREYRNRNQNL